MQKRFRMVVKEMNGDLHMRPRRDFDAGSDRKLQGKSTFPPISEKKHPCRCNGNCLDCRCKEKGKGN